jgi:hypothetical protein
MDLLCDTLRGSLRLEFDLARLDLAQARQAQRAKDTPAVRARLDECRARLDHILDDWNRSQART